MVTHADLQFWSMEPIQKHLAYCAEHMIDPSPALIASAVLNVVEPKIRADERTQRDAYWQPRLETAWVQLDETTVPILRARTALADLRTKVEALFDDDNLVIPADALIAVLALIDGGTP